MEGNEIRRIYYLYHTITEQSQRPNLISCGISDTVMLLTFTGLHANSISKVAQESHLTLSFLPPYLAEELVCHSLSTEVPPTGGMARSLPTAVPDSPRFHPGFIPRTPRTPRLQDPNKTPRFYPVVKEARSFDVKVNGKTYLKKKKRQKPVKLMFVHTV